MTNELKTSLRIDASTTGKEKVEALANALRGIGVQADMAEGMAQGMAEEIDKVGPRKKAIEELKQAFIGLGLSEHEAEKATRATVDAVDDLDKKAKRSSRSTLDLATSLKTLVGAAIVKKFTDANASLEAMEKSLELITGSSAEARKEMAFVESEANRLGIEVISAANSYTQLAAAAKGTDLEGENTRQIWSAVAESMTRLGKSQADTEGALLAISQMMSKGNVQAEELRGQLGERLPGAFQAAARALGTTTQGLDQMLQSGTILSATFLPKFAAELRKVSGGGGEVDIFNSRVGRLKTSVIELFKAVGDTGVFSLFSWGVKKAAEVTHLAAAEIDYLRAKLRGTDEEAKKAGEALHEAATRFYGASDAAKSAGQEIEGMGKAALQASADVRASVNQQFAESLLKLRNDVGGTQKAFENLGIDNQRLSSEMTKSEQIVIDSFRQIVKDSNSSGQAIVGAFINALDKVSKDAAPALGFALKTAIRQGRVEGDLAAAAMATLRAKLDDTIPAAEQLRKAYEALGVTSKTSLEVAADTAKAAFETLVKQKAPVEDLRVAYQAYASTAWEAAQRADIGQRQVVKSTLDAKAAALNLINVYTDHGNLVFKTLDGWIKRYDQFMDAQERAADAAQKMAGEAAAISADTVGHLAPLQYRIDEFHAHVAGLGEAVAYQINKARDEIKQSTNDSEAALRAFNRAVNNGEIGDVGRWLSKMWMGTHKIEQEYAKQIKELNSFIDDLAKTPAAMHSASQYLAVMTAESHDAAGSISMLGDADLSRLQQSIDQAAQKMRELESASKDTLSSVQDEFDRYFGNLEEAQKRQDKARLSQLQAQLATAQAAGDTVATANIEKAIQLWNKLSAAKERDASTQEKSNKAAKESVSTTSKVTEKSSDLTASGSATADTVPTVSRHEVVVKLPSGKSETVTMASESDATSLVDILKQLGNDKGRAQQ